MNRFSLGQIFTDAELKRIVELGDRVLVRDQIIVPNMERINRALGQENDPDYLAFAVEYVMVRAGGWGGQEAWLKEILNA